MKTLATSSLLIGLLILSSCSSSIPKNDVTERMPSSVVKIISSPKQVGIIFLGKTIDRLKLEINTPEFILNHDIERDRFKTATPIGDFFLKPGTVLKLTKDTYIHTKAPNRFSGIDKDSMFSLKEGTKIRILQYDYNSLTDNIAVVEVID